MTDAYFAGFFDGEGTVVIGRGSKNLKNGKATIQYVLLVAVSNTVYEPLRQFQNRYGGRIHAIKTQKSHYKQAWKWTIWAKKAEVFLCAVRPFLLIKGPEADIGLELRKRHIYTKGRRATLSQEETDARDELVRRLRASPNRKKGTTTIHI